MTEVFEGSEIDLDSEPKGRGSREWAEALALEGMALVEKQNNWLRLGKILKLLRDTQSASSQKKKAFAELGYSNFYELAKEEFGVSRRQADYVIKLYVTMAEELSPVPWHKRKKLLDLGYFRLRTLLPVLSPSNYEDWILLAEGKSSEEITAMVRKYREVLLQRFEEAERLQKERLDSSLVDERVKKEPKKPKRKVKRVSDSEPADVTVEKSDPYAEEDDDALLFETRRRKRRGAEVIEVEMPSPQEVIGNEPLDFRIRHDFSVLPDQHAVIKQAVACAGRILGTESFSQCITLVCVDFLATNGAAPRGTPEMVAYFANLEKMFGYRIFALDALRDNELVYGALNLQKLLEKEGGR